MLSKFRETAHAVAYIKNGLRAAHVPAKMELSAVLHGDDVVASHVVDTVEIGELLQRECMRFPQATAVVGHTRAGETYAAIQCRCEGNYRQYCKYHCEHASSRPLMLMLCPESNEEKRAGLLKAVQDEINEDLKAEKARQKMMRKEYRKR